MVSRPELWQSVSRPCRFCTLPLYFTAFLNRDRVCLIILNNGGPQFGYNTFKLSLLLGFHIFSVFFCHWNFAINILCIHIFTDLCYCSIGRIPRSGFMGQRVCEFWVGMVMGPIVWGVFQDRAMWFSLTGFDSALRTHLWSLSSRTTPRKAYSSPVSSNVLLITQLHVPYGWSGYFLKYSSLWGDLLPIGRHPQRGTVSFLMPVVQ